MKLAQVALYQTYRDFDIWHFDTRNSFFFQVGRMRCLKECLQALPPSPSLLRIPLAADPACRLLTFSIILTQREPGTGYVFLLPFPFLSPLLTQCDGCLEDYMADHGWVVGIASPGSIILSTGLAGDTGGSWISQASSSIQHDRD